MEVDIKLNLTINGLTLENVSKQRVRGVVTITSHSGILKLNNIPNKNQNTSKSNSDHLKIK